MAHDQQLRLSGYSLLTGNPFVDNGLAVIAARAGCKTIDHLTLAKIRNVHRGAKQGRSRNSNPQPEPEPPGMKLARDNDPLRATWLLFPDSMLTNPSHSKNQARLANYAKITTAILGNIGNEARYEHCDICGNIGSVDLDRLFKEALPEISHGKGKHHYVDRAWFPLLGSMGSDAQALPAASRSLHCCAKCLLAVQYLPQCVFSNKGKLAVFSSTSLPLWYQLAKEFIDEIRKPLSAGTDKVETMGSKRDSRSGSSRFSAAIRRMLVVMRRLKRSDISGQISVSVWSFTNFGSDPDIEKERIPNFALEFLYEVAKHVRDTEVNPLLDKDKQYRGSLLDCIIRRVDYLQLYPSHKYSKDGASHRLFMLYQTIVLGHSVSSLRTAYNIAMYVKAKVSEDVSDRLGIDLDKTGDKRVRVKQLMVSMVKDGLLSLDEYYELFITGAENGNPWRLVKYYLLGELPSADFGTVGSDTIEGNRSQDQAAGVQG